MTDAGLKRVEENKVDHIELLDDIPEKAKELILRMILVNTNER